MVSFNSVFFTVRNAEAILKLFNPKNILNHLTGPVLLNLYI